MPLVTLSDMLDFDCPSQANNFQLSMNAINVCQALFVVDDDLTFDSFWLCLTRGKIIYITARTTLKERREQSYP